MLTIVTGPPCGGKTTHVREGKLPGDIVIDFDELASAVGSPDGHDHPSHIVTVAKAARLAAIDAAIELHLRDGERVWIIDSAPSGRARYQYERARGAFVKLTADATELHRRATEAGRPEIWHRLIDEFLAR